MTWLLQAKFPQLQCLEPAQTGYGITHAVIQYKAMADLVTSEDLVVLPYADYYLARNYGGSQLIRTLSNGLENSIGGRARLSKATYPVARTAGEWSLLIEYIRMSCELNEYCERTGSSARRHDRGDEVTLQFFSRVNAKVLLAYLNGPDDDPVVTTLASRDTCHRHTSWIGEVLSGMTLASLTRTPGRRPHYSWFTRISEAISPATSMLGESRCTRLDPRSVEECAGADAPG